MFLPGLFQGTIIPKLNFFLFHGGIALLILAHVLYPYPIRRGNKNHDHFAIAIELLNAYDIMDVVDNISCIQTYSTVWFAIFFIALAVSAFHLAFPIGLTEKDRCDPQWGRIISSIITLMFTDMAFAVIRGKVMLHEKNVQLGFNFFSKNVMAALWRICLITKAFCKNRQEVEVNRNHYTRWQTDETPM